MSFLWPLFRVLTFSFSYFEAAQIGHEAPEERQKADLAAELCLSDSGEDNSSEEDEHPSGEHSWPNTVLGSAV